MNGGSGFLRSIVGIGLLLAVPIGPLAAPAAAQEAPPAKAAARPAQEAAQGHLWWNDEEVVASLSLTADQRKQMDALLEKFRREQAAGSNVAKQHEIFMTSLRKGEVRAARTSLAAWADAEGARVRTQGGFRLDLLSLLTAEQWKSLLSARPELISAVWAPRRSWKARPLQVPAPARPPGPR